MHLQSNFGFMVKLKSFIDVNKRIVLNLIELDEQNASLGVNLDDAVIAVWEALVYLDYKKLDAKDSKLRYVASMSRVPGAKMNRFRSYTREALHEALRKERLVNLTSSIEKECVLSDLKVIERIDKHETVVLNERLKESYKRIKVEAWPFGTDLYEEQKVSRPVRKMKGPKFLKYKAGKSVEEALAPCIDLYIEDWDYVVERESYKWDAVKCFQEHFSLDAEDFVEMMRASLDKTDNLLSGNMYFARATILKMMETNPEDVRTCFRHLYDESIDIADRMTSFLQRIKKLFSIQKAQGLFKDNETYQQSSRTVSVYLSLNKPAEHYLYMEKMYQTFLDVTGADLPKIGRTDYVLFEYEMVCDEIRKILLKNDKLVALHDKTYSDIYDYHLLTQDFLYYVSTHYLVLHPTGKEE